MKRKIGRIFLFFLASLAFLMVGGVFVLAFIVLNRDFGFWFAIMPFAIAGTISFMIIKGLEWTK
jgi:hypothetical protein